MRPEDLFANFVLLLFAGHETTRNLIGNAVHILVTHSVESQNGIRGQFLTLYCINSFINLDSLLASLSISACILDTLDGDTPNIPATAFRLRFTTLRNR